jgi:hypothetical protein
MPSIEKTERYSKHGIYDTIPYVKLTWRYLKVNPNYVIKLWHQLKWNYFKYILNDFYQTMLKVFKIVSRQCSDIFNATNQES